MAHGIQDKPSKALSNPGVSGTLPAHPTIPEKNGFIERRVSH